MIISVVAFAVFAFPILVALMRGAYRALLGDDNRYDHIATNKTTDVWLSGRPYNGGVM